MISVLLIAAISSADTVYVRSKGPAPASQLHRLVEEMRIAPSVDDTTLFTEVATFAVDRAGRFWVYDSQANTIFLFDRAGKLIRRVGRQGSGPGEFRSVNSIVATGDSEVAVWDSQLFRVSFFKASGDLRTSWPT